MIFKLLLCGILAGTGYVSGEINDQLVTKEIIEVKQIKADKVKVMIIGGKNDQKKSCNGV